jgi:transcriptional regulator with XRE-family HTH domain
MIDIINFVDFSNWITQKFIDWRGDRHGRGSSVADFALLFGASQQLVSDWMRKGGKKPRAAKYINALAAVYGDEVYEVLGLRKPPDDFAQFPEPLASHLRAASDEIESLLNSGRFPPNSPEHAEAAREIFKRHGLDLKDIDIEE